MTIDRKKKKTAKVSLRESLNNCQTMWREKKEREKLAKMPSQMAHISKLNYQYVSEKYGAAGGSWVFGSIRFSL